MIAIAVLLLIASPHRLIAQSHTIEGLWEAWSASVDGHAHHWTLLLKDDGSFVRADLSDDPEHPYRAEEGLYELTVSALALQPADDYGIGPTAYAIVSDSQLTWQESSGVLFSRGRSIDTADLVGTWELFYEGESTGSTMTLHEDGTYDADLVEWTEHGPFRVSGSGMVHWPTECSREDLMGVPGVWTNVEVDASTLSYTIRTGSRIHGYRYEPTVVAGLSWGALKLQRSGQ